MQRFYTTTVRWEETPWSFTVTSLPAASLDLPDRVSSRDEYADAPFTQALSVLGLTGEFRHLDFGTEDLRSRLADALVALHVTGDRLYETGVSRDARLAAPRDLRMAVDYVLTEPIHVFEQSPPHIDSIIAAARTGGTFVGGVALSMAITDGRLSPMILLALPAGVLVFGAGRLLAGQLQDLNRAQRLSGLRRSLLELRRIQNEGLLAEGAADAIKSELVRGVLQDLTDGRDS